jgi:hypothetical protein
MFVIDMRTTLTSLGILLLLGLVGVTIYTRVSHRQSHDPATSTTIQERILKTFYNQDFGIAFNYPDSYVLDERHDTGASTSHYAISMVESKTQALMPTNTDGPAMISVEVYGNPKHLSVDTWIKTVPESNFSLSSTQQLSKTAIAGKEAYAYGYDGLYRNAAIVFARRGYIYMITVGYNAPSDATYRDFASIVSSIQLDP